MSQIIFPTNTTTLLVNTLSANKIVYLPAVSTVNAGSTYFIKDICGNAAISSIFIYAAGADTIENRNANSAAALLNANFGAVLLVPDGISNWLVVQHYNTNTITRAITSAPSAITSVTLNFIVGNTYILANWSPSTDVTSYSAVFYSNASNSTIGGTLFQTITPITTTFVKTTNGLVANTFYYVIVTATNSVGSTSRTSSTTYTTNLPPVPQFISLSYSGFIFTCTWYPSITATTYNVVFYQNTTSQSTVGATVFQTFNAVSALTQVSSTTPTNGYYYYATVVAVNGALLSTAGISGIIIFSTAPGSVSNISIAFVYPNIAVSWSASIQTTSYTVVFYQRATPGTSGGAVFQTVTGITGTSQSSSTIATLNYYCYVIVRSVNSSTTTSVTSSSSVQATLSPGSVSNVTINFVYPNIAVSWSASIQTSSYTIVFYESATPGTSGGSTFQTFTGVTGTSQTSSTIATLNYYYYAIITSVNPYTTTTVTTATSVQATLAPTVTNVSVSLVYPNLRVTWTSIQANSYIVYFYSSGGSLLETDTPGTTSQTSAFALTDGASYYVTVTATNPYTSTTVTTSPQQISLQPTVNSVTMSFSGNQATATWTTTSGTTFTVIFYENSSNSTTGGTLIETVTSLTGTSRATTATLTSGLYYYATVQAFNANGQSSIVLSSSAIQAAILPTGGAITMSLTSVQDGGSVTITPASLATTYTIFISTSTDGLNVIYSFTTSTTGSPVTFVPSPTPLTVNTTYYARVVPSNIYGNGTASYSPGATTNIFYSYTGTLTFTNATATGRNGPILSQCRTAYSSFGSWINNTNFFNMTTQGIQRWTVPFTRNYTIVCKGANNDGIIGSSTPRNIIITATILLTQGEVINILVGQTALANSYGGSGGSFVVRSNGTPLIVAGGIGGMLGTSSSPSDSSSSTSGNTGETGDYYPYGTRGAGGVGGAGGNGGSVGELGTYFSVSTWSYYWDLYGGGGGGGFTGNGGSAVGRSTVGNPSGYLDTNATVVSGGGFSYSNGGMGGIVGSVFDSYSTNFCINGAGGFGGGGSAGITKSYNNVSPPSAAPTAYSNYTFGGGGGYSGGGGAGGTYVDGGYTGGGGGGSFYPAGATLTYTNAKGNGYVSIT